MTPLFTVLTSLGSALLASLFTQWLVFRFSERQRRLELYKIVYPEKFKAIKEFMSRAYALQIEVINAPNDQKIVSINLGLVEKIKQLSREVDANRWLFGEDVTDALHKIRSIMMRDQFDTAQTSSDIELMKAFDAFNTKIDKELGISKLSNTFK